MDVKMRVVTTGLQFPEGPVALADGSVLVTEVAAHRVSRVAPDGRINPIATPGGSPAGAAIGPNGKCYVCNGGGTKYRMRDGFLLPAGSEEGGRGRIEMVDVDTGHFEVLYDNCDGVPLNAPNDLVFDVTGSFWFTDHGKTRASVVDRGWVYYAKNDGSSIKRVIGPIMGPNGTGLSPDGKRLYIAQTESARLWGFDVGEPGTVVKSPAAEFRRVGHLMAGVGGYQMFDSLAIDAEGWILVATLLNGGITAVSPDAKEVFHIPIAERFATNVCFGGKYMRTAYVTLGSTGQLVALDWPRPGLRLNFQEAIQ